MPTNSSEGDIVYEKKNLRLKYVLEKNPENLSERSAVGKSIAGKEKKGRFYYNQKINCMRAGGFAEYNGKRYEFTRKNISERSTGDEVCGHMITLGTGVPGTAM
mgnify:CR=1 FL=1